jgi:hypothetical protein
MKKSVGQYIRMGKPLYSMGGNETSKACYDKTIENSSKLKSRTMDDLLVSLLKMYTK